MASDIRLLVISSFDRCRPNDQLVVLDIAENTWRCRNVRLGEDIDFDVRAHKAKVIAKNPFVDRIALINAVVRSKSGPLQLQVSSRRDRWRPVWVEISNAALSVFFDQNAAAPKMRLRLVNPEAHTLAGERFSVAVPGERVLVFLAADASSAAEWLSAIYANAVSS